MTDEEIMEMLKKDPDFKNKFSVFISELIEKEMSEKSPDYDKIDHLSELYCSITGVNEIIKQRKAENINKIISEASKVKQKRKHRTRKTLTAIAASVAVVLSANVVSTAAFGVNIFKAIVHKEEKGFFIEYTTDEKLEDPYGIKAECAKYEIYPEYPKYIPEGFEVLEINHEDLGKEKTLDFLYYKDDMTIGIYYDVFDNPEEIKKIKYPSDDLNIIEIEINGYPAVVSKEDDQCTLSYAKDNVLLSIFTVNVPYEECDKIIESIK
ncbi:DUF4367 domain-containing protein [Ruminococcus sp. HUN007]|uniref:DUF4367 domain-containing protein n=1 Tax=Ruminococcus sp. HUN007 TaxID=1514668 RepID=UPI0005D2285B|nr:DUF4367 domain-containing protein [Ruminococcus sp. HUN007]